MGREGGESCQSSLVQILAVHANAQIAFISNVYQTPTMKSFQGFRQRVRDTISLSYVGSGRVKIDRLSFPHSSGLRRDNVQRLIALFRDQRGCNSEDLQH